ncbi:MAG: DUF3575 domain-containing protein [Bacteroidetes bacterium]|nr:DUF3575 domain-containing protein [Bacteroidota bacterium]
MKKTMMGITILGLHLLNAQNKTAIKGNAMFAPLGMINIGIERQLSSKYTLQLDGFISPWKSINNNHAQVYMAHTEGRYYFKEAFKHWYIGVNAGFGLFDLTKWNYNGTDRFQRGFNIMFGGTVGYQLQWKQNWNIDFYLGGGTSQGYYHGYESISPHSFVRYDDATGWNKSGEWIPYRGGIMVSYLIN